MNKYEQYRQQILGYYLSSHKPSLSVIRATRKQYRKQMHQSQADALDRLMDLVCSS